MMMQLLLQMEVMHAVAVVSEFGECGSGSVLGSLPARWR